MTIHSIDTTFNYGAPDVREIRKNAELISYKTGALSNFYLSSLRDELYNLLQKVNATTNMTQKVLTLAPSVLDDTSIKQYLNAIKKLEKNELTKAQKIAITSYHDEIITAMDESQAEVASLSNDLNISLLKLKEFRRSDNQFRIEELDKRLSDLSPFYDKARASIESLEKKEVDLNAAIAILELENFFSRAKKIVLNAKELADLNMAAPQADLVKAGVDVAAELLEMASTAVQYNKLIEARKRLQEQLDERRPTLVQLNKEKQELQKHKEQLELAQTVDIPKKQYADQIEILIDALYKYLEITHHENFDTMEDRIQVFIHHSALLKNMLTTLHANWRN